MRLSADSGVGNRTQGLMAGSLSRQLGEALHAMPSDSTQRVTI